MQIARVLFAVAWLVTMLMSAQAVRTMGFGAAGQVFFADFAHPWRAQFNTDFGFHLLLMAGFIWFREKDWLRGGLLALGAVMIGGAFSFAYLFVTTFTAKGDWRTFWLGARTGT